MLKACEEWADMAGVRSSSYVLCRCRPVRLLRCQIPEIAQYATPAQLAGVQEGPLCLRIVERC